MEQRDIFYRQYWCGPTLSKILKSLGCESQFDYWWGLCPKENHRDEFMVFHSTAILVHSDPAFHFSDCIIPINARKIVTATGNIPWLSLGSNLLIKLQVGENWQEWLLDVIKNDFCDCCYGGVCDAE